MKNKSYIMRLVCGSLAAVMLVGASAAYAQEDDVETEDAQGAEIVQQEPEDISASEQSTSSSVDAPESHPKQDEEQDEQQPEVPDKSDEQQPEKTEKTDKPEKSDKADKTDKNDDKDTPDTPEKPDKSDELSISLSVDNNSTLSLKAGKSKKVYAQVTPEGTEVSWTSSNESVASAAVSGNTLTADIKALGEGTCIITASVSNDTYAKFYVSVKVKKNKISNNTNNFPSKFTSGNTSLPSSSVSWSTSQPTVSTPVSSYKMPENIPENVALTVSSSLDKNTDTMLDALYSYDRYATFFVNPNDIYKKDNRVRRIVGQGHSLGIKLTAKQAQNTDKVLKTLKRANNDLTTVCGMPTRLVSVEGGSGNLPDKTYKALKKAGYRVWDWNYSTGNVTDAKKSAHTLEDKMDTKDRVVVRIGGDKNSAAMLTETLGYMNYVQIPTQAIADSDIPVCFADK